MPCCNPLKYFHTIQFTKPDKCNFQHIEIMDKQTIGMIVVSSYFHGLMLIEGQKRFDFHDDLILYIRDIKHLQCLPAKCPLWP